MYQYNKEVLITLLSDSAIQFFFNDVTPDTTAIEIRERVRAFSEVLAGILVTVSADGDYRMDIAKQLNAKTQQVTADMEAMMIESLQPNGFIWQKIQKMKGL
ncbi:hypothetical protein FJD32_009525 [Shewanella sp. LC6]|uniref:hypothetical protein n=1 Tax=Shewanella TaxID=22 RepID=UPI0010572B5B|nr:MULTISPECIES: hypothetical protein [Shewanella]QQK59723.1 hypothetical protein FJD32_009525 [Shewanella sp. LC6]TPE56690.1 hypothetical protein FJD33_14115 [Shewanella sp. LC2]